MLKVAGNTLSFSAFLPPSINITAQLMLQIIVADKCSGDSGSSVSLIVLWTDHFKFLYRFPAKKDL